MQCCSFYSGIYCVCFTLWPIIKLLWHNHKHNMTKDMLLNPTSRAPCIWIAFAKKNTGVPVLLSNIFSSSFFYLHCEIPTESDVVFPRQTLLAKQSIQQDEHSTFQYTIQTENTSTTEENISRCVSPRCFILQATKWKCKNSFHDVIRETYSRPCSTNTTHGH